MIVRWVIVAPLVAAIGLGTVAISQRQIDDLRVDAFEEELLYLPNENLLNHFTGGMNNVIADLLWLRCIQYTSQEWRGDFKFTWLEHMCKTITRLDPHFHDVYQWGGMALAMLRHDDEASIHLLKSGVPNCPDRWELPFEIGRTYVLNRHDEPRGAIYLAMAVATGDAPPFVRDWAVNLNSAHGLFEVERGMWQDILDHSQEEHMRELAERKLQEINLREVAKVLTDVAKRYSEERGSIPTSLQDLEDAGYIRGRPEDPLGGSFIVNEDGEFFSTTVLDAIKEERRALLEIWIGQYKEQLGTWPAKLEDIVGRTHAPGVLVHPYPGGSWEYDPATGAVR